MAPTLMAKTAVEMGPGLLLGLTDRLGWVARTRGHPIDVDDALGAINESSIFTFFALVGVLRRMEYFWLRMGGVSSKVKYKTGHLAHYWPAWDAL